MIPKAPIPQDIVDPGRMRERYPINTLWGKWFAQLVNLINKPPACQVGLSGTFTPATGSWVAVPFDTKDYDINKNYDIVNYQFTAPSNGIYYVYLMVSPIGSVAGNVKCRVNKNGIEHIRCNKYRQTTPTLFTMQCSRTCKLLKGDIITAEVYVTPASTFDADLPENRIEIYKLQGIV